MLMPFGKYKGEELEDVPHDYLAWLLKENRKLNQAIEEELDGDDLRALEKKLDIFFGFEKKPVVVQGWTKVVSQAEEHKRAYPTFDLDRFLRWFNGLSLQQKTIMNKKPNTAARVKSMRSHLAIEQLARKD